jgi:hypothetical protein
MPRNEISLDTAKFQRGLERTLRDIERVTRRDLMRLGDVAAADMRATVARETNSTAATITTAPGHDARGFYVEIRAGDAAVALEYGTLDPDGSVHMEPQPFFRPALRRTRRRAKRIIGRR